MSRNGTNNKGGRPKGVKTKRVLDRLKVFEQLKDRGAKMAQSLIGSQALIAHGTHTLMRIDESVEYRDTGKTDKQGNPSKARFVTKKYEVVTNPKEIEKVFNSFQDVDGSGVVDDKYYFVTHKDPQNNAIDSILNRVFGRPTESIEVSGKDGEPLAINLFK